jgi:hypothetical protein
VPVTKANLPEITSTGSGGASSLSRSSVILASRLLNQFSPSPRLVSSLAPPNCLSDVEFPGGASVPASRGVKSFSAPNQIEYPTLAWPVFNSLHQAFADRVFLHVKPLLRIIFAIAQPVMPATRLKSPFWWGEATDEPLAFCWWGEPPVPL